MGEIKFNNAKFVCDSNGIKIANDDVDTPDDYIIHNHNGTDDINTIGKGSTLVDNVAPVSLADDASFDLPDASAGYGVLIVGDSEEYCEFHWTTAGVVTLVNETANVVATDTDANFCLFDNGTAVRIRNRLGTAKKVTFSIHYTTSP